MTRSTCRALTFAALLAIFFAFGPGPARAASLDAPASLEALVDRCSGAFRGEVVGSATAWDGRILVTHYQIRVRERVFGAGPDDEGELVVVTLPGGVWGDLRLEAAGVPSWSPGEEVVVFERGDGRPTLAGLFTVEGDALVDPLGVRGHAFPRTLPELRDRLDRAGARPSRSE